MTNTETQEEKILKMPCFKHKQPHIYSQHCYSLRQRKNDPQ